MQKRSVPYPVIHFRPQLPVSMKQRTDSSQFTLLSFQPFHSQAQKVHSPNLLKRYVFVT